MKINNYIYHEHHTSLRVVGQGNAGQGSSTCTVALFGILHSTTSSIQAFRIGIPAFFCSGTTLALLAAGLAEAAGWWQVGCHRLSPSLCTSLCGL